VYGAFTGTGSRGTGVGRWYVLNIIALGYVQYGDVGVLYAYMYMSLRGRGASNFQYIFSTDGFMLTCFGGSSKKLGIYIVRMFLVVITSCIYLRI
jgi:hypothetical protein